MPHLPYSPHLAPSDFLLPRMKKALKGKRFPDMEEMKQKKAEALKVAEFKLFWAVEKTSR